MYQSILEQRGPVPFPEFRGDRFYMVPFVPRDGLPCEMAHWQPTVDAMLRGIEVPGVAYIMVDQKTVAPGKAQRRPGVHIDGYWLQDTRSHGGGRHSGSWDQGNRWKHCSFDVPEALLLASDRVGSRAFVGNWSGPVGEGGCLADADLSATEAVPLQAGHCYAGNVTMAHESLPLQAGGQRTLVRINVPGWSPA